eukprot:jgi/Galph1/5925/GphlegSOOS_G4553.1
MIQRRQVDDPFEKVVQHHPEKKPSMELQVEELLKQCTINVTHFNPLLKAAHLYDSITDNTSFQQCVDKLTVELNTLQEKLTDNIWNKRPQLIQATEFVRQVQKEASCLSKMVNETRQRLYAASQCTSTGGEDIVKLENRRKFLKQTENTLLALQELIQVNVLAEMALKRNQLSECHSLCKKFENILSNTTGQRGDLRSLVSLKSFSDRITKVAVECVKRMHRNLRSLCKHLDIEEFLTIFHAYEEFGAAEELASRLSAEYCRVIVDVPTEVEVDLSEERKKSSMVSGICTLADVLVSFHTLVDYLKKRYESMDNTQTKENVVSQNVSSESKEGYGDQYYVTRRKYNSSREFAMAVHAYLIPRKEIWKTVESTFCKWIEEWKMGSHPISTSYMHSIYIGTKLLQILGEIFTSYEEGNAVENETVEDTTFSNELTRKLYYTPIFESTKKVLIRSFEYQHEENLQTFRKNLKQERWQRIAAEPTDFSNFFASFHRLMSQTNKDGTTAQRVAEILRQGRHPLNELWLEGNFVDEIESTNAMDEALKIASHEDGYQSCIFVASGLILLNIASRYCETACSVECCKVSVMQSISELFNTYLYHVYSICDMICRRTEVELERAERGRELRLSDFLTAKDHAFLRQLFQAERISKSITSEHWEINVSIYDACIAVESFKSLSDFFMRCTEKLSTSEFFSESEKTTILRSWRASNALTTPIRSAVYDFVAAQIIEARQFIQGIANGNYNLHSSNSFFQKDNTDLEDQPSCAVAHVLQNIANAMKKGDKLPAVCSETLWERVAATCCHTFLVGVSKVKHCTPEGRARMLVDLRHLERGLEIFIGLKPIPGVERVASHIRAYFLDEKEILGWAQTEAPKLGLSDLQIQTLVESGPGKNISRFNRNALVSKVLQIVHEAKGQQQQHLSSHKEDLEENLKSESSQVSVQNNENKESHPHVDTTSSKEINSDQNDRTIVPMIQILGEDILSELFQETTENENPSGS